MHPFFFFFYTQVAVPHDCYLTTGLLQLGFLLHNSSLIFNHQVPPVCTSQDPAHSYSSFFSHSPIGSLLFLSQNTLFKAAYDVLS